VPIHANFPQVVRWPRRRRNRGRVLQGVVPNGSRSPDPRLGSRPSRPVSRWVARNAAPCSPMASCLPTLPIVQPRDSKSLYYHQRIDGTPLSPQFVLARLILDYRREMRWPGAVEIGTRVERIGRSSITLAQALFQNDCCVATAQSVAVLIDARSRRACPIPLASVQRLQSFACTGASADGQPALTVTHFQWPGTPASERPNGPPVNFAPNGRCLGPARVLPPVGRSMRHRPPPPARPRKPLRRSAQTVSRC
jgi:hypothetical protein